MTETEGEPGMERFEHIVVCVDDTDDLSKETSTGAVAEAIAAEAARLGGTVDLDVTRHQLLLDERVPYTSHNSAMAFTARLPCGARAELSRRAVSTVGRMRAESSDPGLAIGSVPERGDAGLDELVAFGLRAQREVLAKRDALELAARIPWMDLFDLGGTGDGVIGALAGAGLRLSGADGRFRGKWDLAALRGADAEGPLTVGEACAALSKRVNGRVAVVDTSGEPFAPDRVLEPTDQVKPILRGGALVIVAADRGASLVPFAKRDLEGLGEGADIGGGACPAFALDNDREEFADDARLRTCANCLYRRLTARGFSCVRVEAAEAREAAVL